MDKISLVVRAVILDENKILLCRKKEEDFYFFPGGNVEFGEKAETALVRELKEEMGVLPTEIDYIGTVENFIEENNKKYHEINLVFEAKMKEKTIESLEDHIGFYWIEVERMKEEKILPTIFKKNVIRWLSDKRCFWGSQDL